jgi:hypothetical protein
MKVARQLSLGRDEISTWRMKTVQSSKVSIFCSYGESNDDKALCWLRSGISTAPTSSSQTYCSAPACQRIRKRQWQRVSFNPTLIIGATSERPNAWQESHPGYWRQYRNAHPEYAERSPDPQRPGPVRGRDSVKMDAWTPPPMFVPGLYKIVPVRGSGESGSGTLIVEITPVCQDCPCKRDACKERTP